MTILNDQIMNIRFRHPRISNILQNITSTSTLLFTCIASALWTILLTSFIVGMIKDVGLGLKIFGYGFAAYLAISFGVSYLSLLFS
jgi:hypothetical protein